jgi:hypothetical protein
MDMVDWNTRPVKRASLALVSARTSPVIARAACSREGGERAIQYAPAAP